MSRGAIKRMGRPKSDVWQIIYMDLMTQLAENPHLIDVFDELFSPEGFEIYLRPASDYVVAGDVPFGLVCEAALRRNELAIGYRTAKGITVNPSKKQSVKLAATDNIIVLAEN